MSKELICPNCGGLVKDHPQDGCVLAALIGVIRDRGGMKERALTNLHASTDADHLWDDVGRIVDQLEAGGYNL